MTKLVVFDMAGTTVNENNIVYKTLREAINEKGIPVSLNEVLAEAAGKEKLQAIISVLNVYGGENDAMPARAIHERFLELLAQAYDKAEIQPQENALEVFHALHTKNILVALNTGYNRETALSLIHKLGWEKTEHFDSLITASDVQKNRPYPDMIFLAMKQLGITDASEVIKVGDSIIDIEEGRNAGCQFTVGITTGAHTAQQLETAKPDYIIDNLSELLRIVSSMDL